MRMHTARGLLNGTRNPIPDRRRMSSARHSSVEVLPACEGWQVGNPQNREPIGRAGKQRCPVRRRGNGEGGVSYNRTEQLRRRGALRYEPLPAPARRALIRRIVSRLNYLTFVEQGGVI